MIAIVLVLVSTVYGIAALVALATALGWALAVLWVLCFGDPKRNDNDALFAEAHRVLEQDAKKESK